MDDAESTLESDELLTYSDLAERFGVCRASIFNLARDDPGFPPRVRDGPAVKFWLSDVIRYEGHCAAQPVQRVFSADGPGHSLADADYLAFVFGVSVRCADGGSAGSYRDRMRAAVAAYSGDVTMCFP